MKSWGCLVLAVLLGIVVCTGLTMSMSILGLTQCGRPRCTCFTQRKLVVCTPGLGPPYTEVPTFSRQEAQNMTRINLSGNALTHIGLRDFNKITWPRLEIVDLRLNPNLDCRSLDNIPEGIVVYTDCIDEDYEVDPALVGDGTGQTYDDTADDNGYQMFETQYAPGRSETQSYGLLSDSNNQMADQRPESVPSQIYDATGNGYNQFPTNSKVTDDNGEQGYSEVPGNSGMSGFYGKSEDDNQETVNKVNSSNEEQPEKSNRGSSKKTRKPKKVIIEFKGMMKVLIP